MNVLFLTLADVCDLNEHDIYQDLMRCFVMHGHKVYVVTGAEKRTKLKTELYQSCGASILRVQIGNQSNCSLVEKGISTILIKHDYLGAINKYIRKTRFDLILYTTPPITLMYLIKKLKKKHNCLTYLMLKDIFPQNAVDLGLIGNEGLIHKYFRKQERELYKTSDFIGCMSDANVSYLLEHNDLLKTKVEVCPNALLPRQVKDISNEDKEILKEKFGIPKEKIVLLYGGNLGKPQGIPFLIECLKATRNDDDIFMLIIGAGSEYAKLENAIYDEEVNNVRLLNRLPREDYLKISRLADVGMIFLENKFTIPNFPSRILPYMENGIPVACVTDCVTDLGSIAETYEFGWECESNDVEEYKTLVNRIKTADRVVMGRNGRKYLEEVYNAENCYRLIVDKGKSIK